MLTSCENSNKNSPAQSYHFPLELNFLLPWLCLHGYYGCIYYFSWNILILETYMWHIYKFHHRSDTVLVSQRAVHRVAAWVFSSLKQIYSHKILLKAFNVNFFVWNQPDTNRIVKPTNIRFAASSIFPSFSEYDDSG